VTTFSGQPIRGGVRNGYGPLQLQYDLETRLGLRPYSPLGIALARANQHRITVRPSPIVLDKSDVTGQPWKTT
jgi:hypothetical protein